MACLLGVQVRRASAWLPCVDVPAASVAFHLDITCRADEASGCSSGHRLQHVLPLQPTVCALHCSCSAPSSWPLTLCPHLAHCCPQVAAGPGQLLRQSWAEGGQQWRTFHYSLPLRCTAASALCLRCFFAMSICR